MSPLFALTFHDFFHFSTWQDVVISSCNLFFAVTLVLMLVNRSTQVPRTSSVPTGTALAVMGITFATMPGFALSTTICTLNGLLWFAIALWRPLRA